MFECDADPTDSIKTGPKQLPVIGSNHTLIGSNHSLIGSNHDILYRVSCDRVKAFETHCQRVHGMPPLRSEREDHTCLAK
jgi:hypothetical protein